MIIIIIKEFQSMFSYKIITILSTLGLALAVGTPNIITSESPEDIKIETPMTLGNGAYWPGKGDFSKSHVLPAKTGLGKKCEDYKKNKKSFNTCLEIDSSSYKLGEKKVLAKGVSCSKPPCSIKVAKPYEQGLEIGMAGDGFGDGYGNEFLDHAESFLPKNVWTEIQSLNSTKSFNLTNKFEGKKSLWFRPLLWYSAGHMATTQTDDKKKSEKLANNLHLNYPIRLPSGTLDGVYGLE